MLNNLALIGIVIIVLWLAAIAYYIYTSRQQKELTNEIEEIREILDKSESEGGENDDDQ